MKYLVCYELEVEVEGSNIDDVHNKLQFVKVHLPSKFSLLRLDAKTIERVEPSIMVTATEFRNKSLTKMEQRIVNQCVGTYVNSNTIIKNVRKAYDYLYGPEVVAEVIGKLVTEEVLRVKDS